MSMKLFLKTLYCLLILMSGLMFMRIILLFAQIGPAHAWAKPLYVVTDVVAVPVAMLLYGIEHPTMVLSGTGNIVEPNVVVSMLATLAIAFFVSSIGHAMEKKGA